MEIHQTYSLLKDQIAIGIEDDQEAQQRIFKHSLKVAEVAKTIATKLGLPNIEDVELGALYHDMTKGEEIKYVKSRGSSYNLSAREKRLHELRAGNITVLSKKAIKKYALATGLPVIHRQLVDGDFLDTIEEKIVFISDQLVQETEIITPLERFNNSQNKYNVSELNALFVYAVKCGDEIALHMGLKNHLELVDFLKKRN